MRPWIALFICLTAAADLPPPPPGLKPVLLSPKAAEFQSSLSKVTVKPGLVEARFAPLTGSGAALAITGIVYSNQTVNLSWQGGVGPYMVQSLDGLAWTNIGSPIDGTAKVFTATAKSQLYRVQDAYPWLSIKSDPEQQPRLTWEGIEFMSDSIDHYVVNRGTTPTNLAPFAGSTLPANATSFNDGLAPNPDLYYRTDAVSVGGRTRSSDVKLVSATPSGAWKKLFTVRPIGNRGTDRVRITDVKLDHAGNMIVFGKWQGSIVFPNGATRSEAGSYLGFKNYFVIKYDSSGNYLWHKSIETGNNVVTVDAPGVLAIDSSDNIYVGSQAYFGPNTVDFGNGVTLSGSSIVISPFVVKYNPSGTAQFAQFCWEGAVGTANYVYGLVIDPLNNLYMCGHCTGGATDFGGGSRDMGIGTAFVLSWTSAGDYRWDVNFVPAAHDQYDVQYARSIAVFGSYVVVGGEFYKSANFGDGVVTTTAPTRASFSGTGYVVKLSTGNGSFVWKKVYSYDECSNVSGVAIDPITQDVVTCGFFYTPVNFGGGLRSFQPGGYGQGASTAIFVVRHAAANGSWIWDNVICDVLINRFSLTGKIAISSLGYIYFNGEDSTSTNPMTEQYDGNASTPLHLVVSLNSDGTFRWFEKSAGPFGSQPQTHSWGLCLSGGLVYSCGYASVGQVNFGTQSGSPAQAAATFSGGSEFGFVSAYKQ